MDATKDFLGSGWKFPPRLDARGKIELSHQYEDVQEAIKIILLTRKGERPLRPEFGSELHKLVFAPNDAATGGLAARYAREALARWEPRIKVTDVRAVNDKEDPSRLLLDIRYYVPALNSERNLVFPYYVIPGED